MDKSRYDKEKKEFKIKRKQAKKAYKDSRPSFRIRVIKKTIQPFFEFLSFISFSYWKIRRKIGDKFYAKKRAINDLKKKVDYIVDSLKTTLNTTDEIRAKTIEDIVENIDDL